MKIVDELNHVRYFINCTNYPAKAPPPPPPNILFNILFKYLINQFGKSLVSSREYHFQKLWNGELVQNLMCHYEVKCCKALWLQAREALWSNCKSSESIFFSCVRNMNCCFAHCAANISTLNLTNHLTSNLRRTPEWDWRRSQLIDRCQSPTPESPSPVDTRPLSAWGRVGEGGGARADRTREGGCRLWVRRRSSRRSPRPWSPKRRRNTRTAM